MICNFCNKQFSNSWNLKNHQKTVKYCLEIQGLKKDDFKCDFCFKNYSQKRELDRHLVNCIEKKLLEKDAIISNLTSEKDKIISEKDKIISEKEDRIKDLQDQLIDIINRYKIDGGIITIGDNWSRYVVHSTIIKSVPNFEFVNAIHPSVIISKKAKLGKGIVAMAGCIMNTNSVIGNFTFFATGAQIEHDCIIEDYASISAGSVLGGHVHVQQFAGVTLNVTVVDRVTIGTNSVVGAGSVVTRSIPPGGLYYGSPAKFIRNRALDENFLK